MALRSHSSRALLLLAALASCELLVAGSLLAATPQAAQHSASKTSPYKPEGLTHSARDYYTLTFGVEDLRVHPTDAGNLIRFTYRVTDPDKAMVLNNRQATPYLIGHTSHVMLQVPVMEKVGPLRQSMRPEADKEYWMVFSNKGGLVKLGERVSVVIGTFRVDGLKVE